jgi:steroid 5-alpha reductase family enzyme
MGSREEEFAGPSPEKSRVRRSRGAGLVVSGAAYAAALLAAVFVVRALPLGHPLAQLGVGTGVATLVVFAVSVIADNSSIYDPYWSLQPFAIAVYYLWNLGSDVGLRQVLVTLLVLLYALRLTGNFYRGWAGLSQEDFRYRGFRERFGRAYWPVSFFGIHLFPTVMVWLGCLPLYAVMRPGTAGIGWLDGVATVAYAGAVGLALVADEQLRRFREEPGNRGRYIHEGLWSVSRHPNYLGEIASWWGLWLFALASGLGNCWTVIGAVAITLMFVYASVPMMEARTLATRLGYDAYREDTPMLLPRLRKQVSERHAD